MTRSLGSIKTAEIQEKLQKTGLINLNHSPCTLGAVRVTNAHAYEAMVKSRVLKFTRFTLIAVLAGVASACTLHGENSGKPVVATSATTTTDQAASPQGITPVSSTPAAYAGVPADPHSYRMGNGDRVRVTVFGEQALTGEYLIDGSGNLSMPLISQVPVGGLTTKEAERRIAERLRAGYLRNPNVTVQVLTYRPFFILGEVQRSGQYNFVNGITIQTAVAIAGGYTARARTSKFKVIRLSPEGRQKLLLKPTARVRPGDTIVVAERFF